jgi:predicted ATPase
VIAGALWHASVVHQLCGDAARVRALTSELADICGEYDLPMWASIGKILNAWSIAETGNRQVVAAMQEGLAEMPPPDRTLTWPYHASLVSQALAGVGDVDAALDIVVNSVKICRSTGERWYEAELVRLHGELLPTEWTHDAEQLFLEAREIARQQQARSFELRAATSLGGMWHARGETSRARAVVAELYQSFTEGHDTADLIAASALLENLSE